MTDLMVENSQNVDDSLFKSMFYRCPSCAGQIILKNERNCECKTCGQPYALRFYKGEVQPDFRINPDDLEIEDQTESFQNKVKLFLRQYPLFYRFLVYVIGPALLLGPTSQTFVNTLPENSKVLNIGAGVMRLKGNVTHLDYEPYEHLEVIGDAHHLPFVDSVFDAVICETLLEHVVKPEQVISEMERVLKPGGKVYVMMPFLFNFHAAPNDYYRFTHRGFLHKMRAFKKEKLKVIAGPTSALTCVLVEWFAMLFSFGSRTLYRPLSLVFMVLLSPLKLMDFVLAFHPEAVRAASVLLFIGTKESVK